MAEVAGMVGPALGLVGTGMDTISGVMSTDTNAKILDARARNIELETQQEANQFSREAKIQAGENNATMAAFSTRDLLDRSDTHSFESIGSILKGLLAKDHGPATEAVME